MTWWLIMGAMVAGTGVLVIGSACCSFARDVDREDRAEGNFVAECKNAALRGSREPARAI
jgi:hypothetical protein